MQRRPNPMLKQRRAIKRDLKTQDYKPNGEQEVTRRRKQIAEGRLKPS